MVYNIVMKLGDKSKTLSSKEENYQSHGRYLPPSYYRVRIELGDKVPADFVEQVIMRVFALDKSAMNNLRVKLLEHRRADCGIFVKEIAETKAAEVMELAKNNEHDLECFIERNNE